MSGRARRDKGRTLLGGQVADQLKGWVSRMEVLDRQFRDISKQKRTIYGEIRASGLNTKAFKLLMRKRQSQDIEDHSDELAVYESLVNTGWPTRRTTSDIQGRAEKLAKQLLGTSDILESFLERDEINNQELLNAIYEKVACCTSCGYWVEFSETDMEGQCLDCDKE